MAGPENAHKPALLESATALREVHRVLVRAVRIQYEREVGPVGGPGHLLRLLTEQKDRLKDRLVAAYVVGWPISTTADLPALGLPACQSDGAITCNWAGSAATISTLGLVASGR